jgi:hypothetical protein
MDMRMSGQCVYAELLADTEFQKIGKENWLKEIKGLGRDALGVFLWGSVVPRGAPGIKKPLPVRQLRRGY